MKPTDPRHDPPLSETDIQAYADGLLTPERAAHLRHYLGKRPGEARRVAFYGKLNQQIQHAFQSTDEPLAAGPAGNGLGGTVRGERLRMWVRTAMRRPLRATLTLAATLALALAAVSGWMMASQVSTEALDNAAVMALAQAAGEHAGEHSGTVAVASDPAAPNLAPVGMHLVSHGTLTLGPLARASEYVYLNTVSEPIVLLVAPTRPAAAAQPQWSARRVGTLRLLTWTAGRERYVLAGAADARGLMRAADFMTMR
ncbi:MAG: transcriptional regulator [Paraburkholderia sp.]|uniref:transcriptional regulator n=1 Tax=Burkholderiaceae TaxID=119060 RepID=UPI0010F544E4|nr:transcriptional regulator [Burkholderia sp. 4M9327F10]